MLLILRPELSKESLAIALTRVCRHEGKGYNFDFDFFRSDQLVCTEVVYRAFDGLDNINFTLVERAGRYSLSAEDIIDCAMSNKGLQLVAGFGFTGCEKRIVSDESATTLVRNSY